MKTEYLKINIFEPEKGKVKYIADILKNGGLVVLPTETVYGIGFKVDSEIAAQKIKAIKKQRQNKFYTLCLAELDWLQRYDLEQQSLKNLELMRDLLPGPITFILNLKDKTKVGFRIPANKITQAIVNYFSEPIYLSSANLSDLTPAKNAQEAIDALWGRVDVIVDGGCADLCFPSLILDLSQELVKILRAGPPFVTEEAKRRFQIE